LLMALNKLGTTIIMATHDLHLLTSHPGLVVQLRQGALVTGNNQEKPDEHN